MYLFIHIWTWWTEQNKRIKEDSRVREGGALEHTYITC